MREMFVPLRHDPELCPGRVSNYLFADRFGRSGKGNDKGKVEGLVGYTRCNFMVPIAFNRI
jgi:transposase